MRNDRSSLFRVSAAVLAAVLVLGAAANAQDYYWDVNDVADGSGNAGGSWDGSYWNTDSTGLGGGTIGTWVDGNAVFSAGTDGVGPFTVTVDTASTSLRNLTFEEGDVTLSGSGSLTLAGSPPPNPSDWTISNRWTAATGASGTVASDIDTNGSILDVQIPNGGGALALSGQITGTGGLKFWNSGGEVVLSGANTYSGGTWTSVHYAKTRIAVDSVGTPDNIVSSAFGTGTVYWAWANGRNGRISSDGTTPRTILNPIVCLGKFYAGDADNPGKLTLAGTMDLGDNVHITAIYSEVQIDGVISSEILGVSGNGPGGFDVYYGPLTLAGANTYHGRTVLKGGSWTRIGVDSVGTVGNIVSGPFGRGGGLSSDGVTEVGLLYFQGGILSSDSSTPRTILNTIRIDGDPIFGIVDQEFLGNDYLGADYDGKLTFLGDATLSATRTMTTNVDTQFDGVIGEGAAGLGINKAGLATLTLAGDNTYTGATTVNEGTLLINGDQSGATGAVTVKLDAMLGGGGRVGGNVTVEDGGGLVWNFDGSTGTTLDLLGTLDFAPGWALTLTGTGTPTGDQDLVIASGGITGFAAPTSIDYGTTGWSDVTVQEDSGRIHLSFSLAGDANGDGFIDDDDLAVLLSNWEQDPGTITTWELGDFTADTDVDDDDLAVLLGNWTGSPPGGAAVPEPASAVLLAIGAATLLWRRRE